MQWVVSQLCTCGSVTRDSCFQRVWKNCECVIHLQVSQCGWQESKITELTACDVAVQVGCGISHVVQTDWGEGQCWLIEIGGEEKWLSSFGKREREGE